MSEEEAAFGHAWCLRTCGMFTYALDAAVGLGLFDILAKAGKDAHLSSSEIASQLYATNPEAPSLVDRVLRLLACYNLVTCISRKLEGDHEDGSNYEVERLYGLALPGKAFVRGESLAGFTTPKSSIDDNWYVELCLINLNDLP